MGRRVMLTVLAIAAAVLGGSVVMPYIAVATVENTAFEQSGNLWGPRETSTVDDESAGGAGVPLQRSDAPADGIGTTGAADGSDSAKAADRSTNLGIRSLPLLSDAARTAAATNRDGMVKKLASTVFGNDLNNVLAASNLLEYGPIGYVSDKFLSGELAGPVPPDDAVADALGDGLDAVEVSDAMDLAGLLLFPEPDPDGNRNPEANTLNMATAFAIFSHLAATTSTCDPALGYAHAVSLLSPLPTGPVWQNAVAKARSRCPGDLTVDALEVYSMLGSLAAGGCVPNVGPDTNARYEQLRQRFVDLSERAPSAAIGLVGQADVLRAEAASSQSIGARAFWVRDARRKALALYNQAAQISADPGITTARLATLVELGDTEAAIDMIDEVDLSNPAAAVVAARALALDGRYDDAIVIRARAPRGAPRTGTAIYTNYNGGRMDSLAVIDGAVNGGITAAGGCGGSNASDLGLVPAFTGPDPTALIGRNAVRYGQPELVEYQILSGELIDAPACNPGGSLCAFTGVTDFTDLDSSHEPYDFDALQDLFRRYGELAMAHNVTKQWAAAYPSKPNPHARLAEICFLQEDWPCATRQGVTAASLYTAHDPYINELELSALTGPGWDLLRAAYAARKAGEPDTARDISDRAHQAQQLSEYVPDSDLALLDIYINQLDGYLAFDDGDYDKAIAAFNKAVAIGNGLAAEWDTFVPRGVLQQWISSAAYLLDDADRAVDAARHAVDADPASPLYQETLAEALRLSSDEPGEGDNASDSDTSTDIDAAEVPGATSIDGTATGVHATVDTVIDGYVQAVAKDPTLFSSWNNLGVILATNGRSDDALEAFTNAVAVKPDYATGWFNLGVAYENHGGIMGFIHSQGAYGKATKLESDWRSAKHTYRIDDEIYSAGIDVSKVVPPDWTLSRTGHTTFNGVTVGLILLLVWRIVWALGLNTALERLTGPLVRRSARWHWLARVNACRPHPVVTGLISAAGLLWVIRPQGLTATLVVGGVIVALIVLHALVVHLRAQPAGRLHGSWVTGSLATVALGVVGVGFAPPTPLAQRPGSGWVRRAGIILLGVACALLLTVSWRTGVPVSHGVLQAASVLTLTALIPVEPLDGSYLSVRRAGNIVITAVVAVVIVALAAGWA